MRCWAFFATGLLNVLMIGWVRYSPGLVCHNAAQISPKRKKKEKNGKKGKKTEENGKNGKNGRKRKKGKKSEATSFRRPLLRNPDYLVTTSLLWATPPVRLGLSGRNSGKIPERPRKRSQSVSWNSPREYGWDAPSPIIQGI